MPLPDTDSMFLSPADYEGSPMLALVGNPEISVDQELYLMMKDGTKITFFKGKVPEVKLFSMQIVQSSRRI